MYVTTSIYSSITNRGQTVFLIDLPKLDVPEAGKTPFYEELVYFLQASELHRNIIKKLDEFDFSETKRYAFVHTMYVFFPMANSPNKNNSHQLTI